MTENAGEPQWPAGGLHSFIDNSPTRFERRIQQSSPQVVDVVVRAEPAPAADSVQRTQSA